MKINGTEYTTPALTFANLCKLEDWGLTVNDMAKRPLGFLAAFVALAVGGDLEDGKSAIEKHIEGGGTIDAISDELSQAVDNSGFFKMENQTKEEKKISA